MLRSLQEKKAMNHYKFFTNLPDTKLDFHQLIISPL